MSGGINTVYERYRILVWSVVKVEWSTWVASCRRRKELRSDKYSSLNDPHVEICIHRRATGVHVSGCLLESLPTAVTTIAIVDAKQLKYLRHSWGFFWGG